MDLFKVIESELATIYSNNVILKSVSKIPKYATKESYIVTCQYGGEDITEVSDVHFIIRHYKKHPKKAFYYGYYLKEFGNEITTNQNLQYCG